MDRRLSQRLLRLLLLLLLLRRRRRRSRLWLGRRGGGSLLGGLAGLGLDGLGLPLAGGLVLLAAGLSLVGERLLERLLLLRLVNVLHQQAAQHAHAAHPQDLDRHARLLGAPPLAVA